MTRVLALSLMPALMLALGGCNLAPDLTALANDPTAMCITITSVWVSTTVNRNHGCELSAGK